MKAGQSLMVKKQLGNEKSLKEQMIHSVMPPKVADWLMKEGHTEGDDDHAGGGGGGGGGAGGDGDNEDVGDEDNFSESGSMMARRMTSPRSSANQGDIRTIFRPFNMNAMDDVRCVFDYTFTSVCYAGLNRFAFVSHFQHSVRRHRGLYEDEFEQDGVAAGRAAERPVRQVRLPMHQMRL